MELVTELWQASGAKVEKDNILQRKSLEFQNVGQYNNKPRKMEIPFARFIVILSYVLKF